MPRKSIEHMGWPELAAEVRQLRANIEVALAIDFEKCTCPDRRCGVDEAELARVLLCGLDALTEQKPDRSRRTTDEVAALGRAFFRDVIGVNNGLVGGPITSREMLLIGTVAEMIVAERTPREA